MNPKGSESRSSPRDPTKSHTHMGGCQNYGAFLGTLILGAVLYSGPKKGVHNFGHDHPHSSLKGALQGALDMKSNSRRRPQEP